MGACKNRRKPFILVEKKISYKQYNIIFRIPRFTRLYYYFYAPEPRGNIIIIIFN